MATYRVLVGGSGAIDGKYVFASEAQKENFLFSINLPEYRGEQFIYDGHKLFAAKTYMDKTRSEFGDFLFAQDVGFRENLLGGVWSADWPLLDAESCKPKLRYQGSKKVAGQDLLALRYWPKHGSDLDITLYFDPQTYQHVLTIYKVTRASGIGATDVASAQLQDTRYEIRERFSDFKPIDGLTLPTHYEIGFTEELENGFTKSVQWEVRASNIKNNLSIDPQTFQVK